MVNETGSGSGVGNGAGNVTFMSTRRGQVQTYLRTALSATFAITTPDPVVTPSPAVDLEGTAPLEVGHLYAVLERGEPRELAVTWTTPPRQTSAIPTIWKARLDGLAPGENVLEVLALTPAMDIVGSDSIRISGATFVRGDVDGATGRNATDVVAILEHVFGTRLLPCADAADSNDDGKVNITDAIVLVLHLYQGYGPLPEPSAAPGFDPTEDGLGCGS
jgi:hypothetical protein